MCVYVFHAHLNDVIPAEDSTRIASITVFSDGALQLRKK